MASLKRRRDSVHNYIPLTDMEWALSRDPMFQRLNFVMQNSCAYVSYPTATGSRYSHSLGVMHVGGRILENSILNASHAALDKFISASRQLFEYMSTKSRCASGFLEKVSWDHVHDLAPQLTYPSSILRGAQAQEPFLIAYIWQSLRLACVFHDIGHFPYSHVMEFAVHDYIVPHLGAQTIDDPLAADVIEKMKKAVENGGDAIPNLVKPFERMAVHETMGRAKLDVFFQEFNEALNAGRLDMNDLWVNDVHRVVFRTAECIFLASRRRPADEEKSLEQFEKLLLCLHEVVSSQIDADRLDYCVRDPHNAAIEFGAIDLERIVQDMVLLYHESEFVIAPKARALSAVEAFFHQRFQLYRYLIYQHNVAQMDAVLQEITRRLLVVAAAGEPEDLFGILCTFVFCNRRADQKGGTFACGTDPGHDDGWYRTMLRGVGRRIRQRRPAGVEEQELDLLITTFLNADFRNIQSLWKRDRQYLDFLQYCLESAGLSDENMDGALRAVRGAASTPEFRSRLDALRRKWSETTPFLLLYRTTPEKSLQTKKDETPLRLCVAEKNGSLGLRAGDSISSYLQSLRAAVDRCAPLQVVLVAENVRKDGRANQAKVELQALFLEEIKRTIEERPIDEK